MTARAVLVFFAAALCAVPAFAATPLEFYLQGQYAQAAAAGEAENTADGLALAARALLSDAELRDAPCLDCIQRAEAMALRAIAIDPAHVESRVYLAMAFGFESRIVGVGAARSGDYAGRAEAALTRALALAPNDAFALAAMGAWQIEVVGAAGRLFGSLGFGARVATGQDYFRRAIAAAPGNVLIHYNHALSLAGYDLPRYRDDIRAALASAASSDARGAYEAAISGRAGQLIAAAATGDREFLALVRRYQGYN